jgi:hypothetical protein
VKGAVVDVGKVGEAAVLELGAKGLLESLTFMKAIWESLRIGASLRMNDVVGNDSVIVGAPTVHGGRLSRIGVGIRRYAKVAFGLVSGLDCE